MTALYISVVTSNFDLKLLTLGDKILIVIYFASLIFYMVLFVFINKNIEAEILT